MGQEGHQRDDVLGFKDLGHVLGKDAGRHSAESDRADRVREDVLRAPLFGAGEREPVDSELCRGVVRLAEVAVQARSRAGVDYPPVALLPESVPDCPGAGVSALQMRVEDGIKIALLYFNHRKVP